MFSSNTQSRFASVVLDGILEPPFIAEHTQQRPSFSAVPEAMHEASQGPLKGVVSAKKALHRSETETRELLVGTEEKSISPTKGQ